MNEEQFKRLDDLMQQLVGREGVRHDAHVIRQLFNLNNELTGIMEYSTSCGSCRSRVFNRVKQLWIDNGGVKQS